MNLIEEQVTQFHQDGFLILEGLFEIEEIDLLRKIARADQELMLEVRSRRDAQGGVTQLTVRYELQEDIYSAFVRCPRILDAIELLLGGEVFYFHHKVNFKEPFIGGAWEWHQDFGYWYSNNFLSPAMVSCMIAVDHATKQNGCLQVIKGSHHLGRIDHGTVGDQSGADPERVNVALERLPVVYCELEPGSALFFHSNLLHRSEQNRSSDPRWSLICCYSAAHNEPFKGTQWRYSYLEKWPDSRIKEIGLRQWEQTFSHLPAHAATSTPEAD